MATAGGNITLPAGASNHGNPNLLCLPTKWSDIAIFFLGSYVAHAATLRSMIGSSMDENIARMLQALLCPVSGIVYGIDAIQSRAQFAKTDLDVAARAGALCKVIRVNGETRNNFPLSPGSKRSWRSLKLYDRVHLPNGYALAIVHERSTFKLNSDPSSSTVLASNYNAVAILTAIVQLAFATTTLYRARGDQIARYGYAAFGLTVTQYALMSLINLLGNLVCPQYPTLYLVQSEEMEEARTHPDAIFEGCVGELDHDEHPSDPTLKVIELIALVLSGLGLSLTPTAISLGVIGGLSRFELGSSTYAQRAWTMAWLVVGPFGGSIAVTYLLRLNRIEARGWEPPKRIYINIVIFQAIVTVSAIGGFVVVGQMLKEYGTCTRI